MVLNIEKIIQGLLTWTREETRLDSQGWTREKDDSLWGGHDDTCLKSQNLGCRSKIIKIPGLSLTVISRSVLDYKKLSKTNKQTKQK